MFVICLFVCLWVYINTVCVCLFVCLWVYINTVCVCLFVCLWVYINTVCVCLFVCLWVYIHTACVCYLFQKLEFDTLNLHKINSRGNAFIEKSPINKNAQRFKESFKLNCQIMNTF